MSRRDEVIRMALEAGFELLDTGNGRAIVEDVSSGDAIERFAALVAAAERERCAKACEENLLRPTSEMWIACNASVRGCIEAIRALKDGEE